MNKYFDEIHGILESLRAKYASSCSKGDLQVAEAHITERDIVAEIYLRLRRSHRLRGCQVHCEIKPAPNRFAKPATLKRLPRIDVVVLSDRDGRSWLAEAKELQNKLEKGPIEARFSSVPVCFFDTAIEVKIQSDVRDAKKDIDKLADILHMNPSCTCFFVLLNARGRPEDHDRIVQYAKARSKEIHVLEYTDRG